MQSAVVKLSKLVTKAGWQFFLFSTEARKLEILLETCLYELVPIRNLVVEHGRGFSKMGTPQSEGVPLLTPVNITEQGSIVVSSNNKFISMDDHKKLRRSMVRPNDVLVSSVLRGSKFVAAVYENDAPANLTSHLIRLKTESAKMDPHYLVAFLNSSLGNLLLRNSATGSVQPSLALSALLELSIPLPPLDKQREIVMAIRDKYREATLLEQKARALRLQASKMMDAFFNREELDNASSVS